MANNRLYLIDTETNEKILLCKSFGQWFLYPTEEVLNNWLKDRDIASTTDKYPTKLILKIENEITSSIASKCQCCGSISYD